MAQPIFDKAWLGFPLLAVGDHWFVARAFVVTGCWAWVDRTITTEWSRGAMLSRGARGAVCREAYHMAGALKYVAIKYQDGRTADTARMGASTQRRGHRE